MRFLFLGDMVGRTGRHAVFEALPDLIADYRLDFVVVNGENAAGGFGITEDIFRATLEAGADVVTTGNHVWDQREALHFAPNEPALRPAGSTQPNVEVASEQTQHSTSKQRFVLSGTT